ncbi:MAG: hypothetical protein ABI718_08310 [Acidobacteriota bacterium]
MINSFIGHYRRPRDARMLTIRQPILTALACVASFTQVASAASPSPAPAIVHGNSLAGVVISVNQTAKTFIVRPHSGASVTLHLTGATRISGGTLAPSAHVQIRWMEVKGKSTATSIAIVPATPPAPRPSPPPTRKQ